MLLKVNLRHHKQIPKDLVFSFYKEWWKWKRKKDFDTFRPRSAEIVSSRGAQPFYRRKASSRIRDFR
ncbi:MAG: hypothetical protein ICV63_11935 [Coleofasciculus sp. Co-bin14]|nr:hypothetical protein [Coleofasciculus sp. Co-bin14]